MRGVQLCEGRPVTRGATRYAEREGDLVKDEPTKEPAVELKPSDYQPSKAELEADKSIDTTPEKLVKAFFSSGAPRREPRS